MASSSFVCIDQKSYIELYDFMQKHNKICGVCGKKMRRNGRTRVGTERFRCMTCGRSETKSREDVRIRHDHDRLVTWLTGVESKDAIAKRYGVTRRALTKEFKSFFRKNPDHPPPIGFKANILLVDAKFIHGDELCALIGIAPNDQLFWQFATAECYGTWYGFLIRFSPPDVVVADGEKGVRRFVKQHWPDTAFQRCHFHMVKLVIQYLSRNPKEEAGRDILDLMYRLKNVKTPELRDHWFLMHRIWEKRYKLLFAEKNESGTFSHRKLRSVRFIVRNALSDLFTYLDFPGCPNTTNLVEGWPNTAIAEGLRRHRGLHLSQKKTLVSIILSHLKREKPTRKFLPEKHT